MSETLGKAGTAYILVKPDFSHLDRDIATHARGMSSHGSKLGRALSTGLKLGAGGAALALGGVAVAAKKSVEAFAEAEAVGKQTNAVLKSTGHAAGLSAKQIATLATQISRKSGMDDEAIQSGENLLLTFRNIHDQAGKGNAIFTRTTRVMADMSIALGQDTKSSAIQLGKALNDPIKGVTALQRVGVSFTQQQKDQIKTLVDSGKTLDAQKLILRELNKEFGGSAKAAGQTFQGSINKAKVEVGNLGEEIGSVLAPALKKGTDRFTEFVEQMQTNQGLGGRFMQGLRHGAKDAEGAVKGLVGRFNQLRHEGDSVGEALGTMLEDGIDKATPKVIDAITERAPRVAGAFAHAFVSAPPLGKLLIGGWLLTKLGGLRAFSSLGAQTGAQMGGGMATGAATGFKSRFKSAFRTGIKGIGIASVITGLITSASEGGDFKDHGQNLASGLLFNLAPTAAMSRLKNAKELVDSVNDSVKDYIATGSGRKAHQAADTLNEISKVKWVDKNAVQEARRQFDRTGDRLDALHNSFSRMRKGSVLDVKELRQSVSSNFSTIRDTMGAKSKKGAEAVSDNTGLAVKSIKRFMKDGTLTTREGMAEIAKVFAASMKLYGITGTQAEATARARAFSLVTGGDSSEVNTKHGRAVGGWIGSRGEAGGDNVPIVVGRGEAVLNRHQQGPVETALRTVYGMGLDDLFARVRRPHFMASGGRVPRQVVSGPAGPERAILQGSLDRSRSAANKRLSREEQKQLALGVLGDVPVGSLPAGVAVPNASWNPAHKPIAKWIIPYLAWAARHGWHGSVNSGFRTFAEQVGLQGHAGPVAAPGHSNHEGATYPRGAVDVDGAAELAAVLGHYPGPHLLQWAGAKDPVHFSHPHNGSYAKGGLVGGSRSGLFSHVWNAARSFFPGGGKRYPGRLITKDTGFFGWATNPGSHRANDPTGEFLIPGGALDALGLGGTYGNGWNLPAPIIAKLLVHEMAHSQQDPRATDSTWKSEGGAEAFARAHTAAIMARAGIPYNAAMGRDSKGDPYRPFMQRVRKTLGQKWIDRGQFGFARGGIAKFARGGIAGFNHNYPRHFLGQRADALSPGEVQMIARAVGFDSAAARTLDQISWGESNREPGMQQRDPGDGNVGYGLLQMTPHAWGPEAVARMNALGGITGMFNPVKNMLMARWLWKRGGWGHWHGTSHVSSFSGGLSGSPSARSVLDGGPGSYGGGGGHPHKRKKAIRRSGTLFSGTFGGGPVRDVDPHFGMSNDAQINADGTVTRHPHFTMTPDNVILPDGTTKYDHPGELDFINRDIATAALTDTTADDIAAADKLVNYWKAQYAQAQATADPRDDIPAAEGLKAAIDSRKALDANTDSQNNLADAIKTLGDEIRRQNEQHDAVVAVGEKTALDMLTGLISSRIGAKVNQRSGVRTFGTVSRP